jgi:hypothetical protein
MRLFLITDKMDKRVPAAQQIGFIDRLRRSGRKIPQLFVEAIDDNHHGVLVYTELVAAGCVLDRSDEDISRVVTTIVRRSTEYNERRQKEIRAKASIVAAARQAAPDPLAARADK